MLDFSASLRASKREATLNSSSLDERLLLGRGVVLRCRRDFVLRGSRYFALGSGSRSAEEEFSPVGEGHVDANALMFEGLGLVALNDELRPGRNRGLGDAVADQRIRATAFKTPIHDGAIGGLFVTPEPRVWIDQFDLRNCAVHDDGLLCIESRREGVMSLHWHCRYEQTQGKNEHGHRQSQSHVYSSSEN
jgi:hypothetical protein